MPFEGNIIRPPSEANSLLLQVTVGCSHNKCIFCPTYLDKHFRVKGIEEIFSDIEASAYPGTEVKKVFLCDGNALIMPTENLVKILDKLNQTFPALQRVGIYANARDILRKSEAELNLLREKGLGIIYLGLESGSNKVLEFVRKGATAQQMIDATKKAQKAGIKMSVIALLGLGGKNFSDEHAIETARVLSAMNPRFVSLLTLIAVTGTPLADMVRSCKFEILSPEEMLREMRVIVENLELEMSIFRSNHASNFLPLGGTFPKDKQKLLETIDLCLEGSVPIRPEIFRGL